ncbi:hypothetical protein BDW69DRAFT_105504 [Aspergillus filifer]
MLHSFPNVRIGLMVGIGGAAPSPNHDIWLGDIVISTPRDGEGGVLQYDFGKTIQDRAFRQTAFLNRPPTVLLTAVAGLKTHYQRKGRQLEEAINLILEKEEDLSEELSRPDASSDRLYRSDFVHPPDNENSCVDICGVDPSDLIQRPERTRRPQSPVVHYGLIASANQLMKDALIRDKLAAERDVLCFEMEAAGLMNHFPCLVIRGICDYSDTHKNKKWQGYAAIAAAAYAKDLLCRIPPNKIEAEKKIAERLSDIEKNVNNMSKFIHSKRDKDVLQWITPVDYAPQHNDFIRQRHPGTGEWFLRSEEFQAWLLNSKKTLFCPGNPGVGKTLITATVVDHVHSTFQDDPGVGIAYLYCNFRQHDVQRVDDMLANLLKQLAQLQSPLPGTVVALYDRHQKNRTRPLLADILETLHSVAIAYRKVFIIVDALDECNKSGDNRAKFLKEIFQLQKNSGINIFATSRFDDDIASAFDGNPCLPISANPGDILAYFNTRMSSRHIDSDTQDMIRTDVLRAADGMFLLVALHTDTLLSKPTKGHIKEALRALGKGMDALDKIYKEAMERIERQEPDSRDLAKQILAWIVHSKRPLSILELQHALAVRKHTTKLDADYVPPGNVLRSLCAGLVAIDEESNIIRLVHYTTQEFFKQNLEEWFPGALSSITTTCVTYLAFDAFESGYCSTNKELEARRASSPLYDYAARNWGHHASEDLEMSGEVMSFLGNRAKVEAASQALLANRSWPSDCPQPRRGVTSLHLVAYLGLEGALDLLLQKDHGVEAADSFDCTPLGWAIEGRNATVIALLLKYDHKIDYQYILVNPFIAGCGNRR